MLIKTKKVIEVDPSSISLPQKNRDVVVLTILPYGVYQKNTKTHQIATNSNSLKLHPYDKNFVVDHFNAIAYYQQTSSSFQHYLTNADRHTYFGDAGDEHWGMLFWRIKNFFSKVPQKINLSDVSPTAAEPDFLLKNTKYIDLSTTEKNSPLYKGVKKLPIAQENKHKKTLKIVINGQGSYDVIHRPYHKPFLVDPESRLLGQIKMPEIIAFIQEQIQAHPNAEQIKITLNSCMSGRIRKEDDISLAGYLQNKLKKIFPFKTITVKGVNGFMFSAATPVQCNGKKGLSTRLLVSPIENFTGVKEKFSAQINQNPLSVLSKTAVLMEKENYIKGHKNPQKQKNPS